MLVWLVIIQLSRGGTPRVLVQQMDSFDSCYQVAQFANEQGSISSWIKAKCIIKKPTTKI